MLDNHQCQLDFGRFIREGREKQDLHQSQVAELLEISQPYYSKIENGVRNIDLTLALKICQVLHLNITDFVGTYLE